MSLDPARIDADADRVVRRLARSGHKAYLVGGCVRDLLLHRNPKDFDVATSATPSEIRDLFRNCRIIGRRFRLAHIFFGTKIIETSTFRANPSRDGNGEGDLLIRQDNVFGTALEDAQRRDFTINGLFYDVEESQVIDYVGGEKDLKAGLVRTIGVPSIRFQEDPVRMLRAIKFAARLGFEIEAETYQALLHHRNEIRKCSPVRVAEEVYRLMRGGAARRSTELLQATGMGKILSPRLAAMFALDSAQPTENDDNSGDSRDNSGSGDSGDPHADPDKTQEPSTARRATPYDTEEIAWWATWNEPPKLELSFLPNRAEMAQRHRTAWRMLDLLDACVAQDHPPSNAVIIASLVMPFIADELLQPGIGASDLSAMIHEAMQPLSDQLHVARRDSERARHILLAQRTLRPGKQRRSRAATALVHRDYFEEALLCYELLARAIGGPLDGIDYWRQILDSNNNTHGRRRRRRRGGRRRRRSLDLDLDDLDDPGDSDFIPSANA